jgi:hypothetical protein
MSELLWRRARAAGVSSGDSAMGEICGGAEEKASQIAQSGGLGDAWASWS